MQSQSYILDILQRQDRLGYERQKQSVHRKEEDNNIQNENSDQAQIRMKREICECHNGLEVDGLAKETLDEIKTNINNPRVATSWRNRQKFQ